jgi:hypothetical protein
VRARQGIADCLPVIVRGTGQLTRIRGRHDEAGPDSQGNSDCQADPDGGLIRRRHAEGVTDSDPRPKLNGPSKLNGKPRLLAIRLALGSADSDIRP